MRRFLRFVLIVAVLVTETCWLGDGEPYTKEEMR